MFTDEQLHEVRAAIARVLSVPFESVVAEARVFADLGANQTQLMSLRLAIEDAMHVKLEPVVEQVNARTAIVQEGRLTKESQAQIIEYLGGWTGRPEQDVSFVDLFTVGMLEAMVRRAASGMPDSLDEKPLQLAPQLVQVVHQQVADVFKLQMDQIHSDLELSSGRHASDARFVEVILQIRESLGVDCDPEWKLFGRCIADAAQGTPTKFTMARLRRFVPDIESIPDDGRDHISTVGLLERLIAAAVERRESPETVRKFVPHHGPVGLYLSTWPWEDQEWWLSLSGQMGSGPFRLYLAGMLRAAAVETARLDGDINAMIEMVEKFAETGSNANLMAKKHQSISGWRWRNLSHRAGLLGVLSPECTPVEAASVLGESERAFHWNQEQVIAAAREWRQSMLSPLTFAEEFKPEWCTPEVVTQARLMHDNRSFVEFPKLGNLLEQAGCTSNLILEHCRDPRRRHLRGDWLIAAVLSAPLQSSAATSKKKTGNGAVKPRKPKLPPMSTSQKKRFRELQFRDHGGLPVAAAWATVWRSDHAADRESFQQKFKSLTPEALTVLGGMFPSLRAVWPETAVVRKFQLQSSLELLVSLSLYARIELLIWLVYSTLHELEKYYLNAFATGDAAALSWMLREFPYHPMLEHEASSWAYLALRAIAARDEGDMIRLLQNWPHPEGSQRVTSIEFVLLSIVRNDATGTIRGLNRILDEQRQSDGPEGFGAFSLSAHACFRVAHWRNPDLVADFDTTQAAPWDQEFHSMSRTLHPSQVLENFDFSESPRLLREILVDQAVPEWLRDIQRSVRLGDDYVGLILTSVGPAPEKVRRLVSFRGDLWSEAEFSHRAKKLPLTLTSAVSRPSSAILVKALEQAGATVETIGWLPR